MIPMSFAEEDEVARVHQSVEQVITVELRELTRKNKMKIRMPESTKSNTCFFQAQMNNGAF